MTPDRELERIELGDDVADALVRAPSVPATAEADQLDEAA